MLISVGETENNSVYTGRENALENVCAPAGERLMSPENYTHGRTQHQSQRLQQYVKYMKYETQTRETSWQPCCGSVDCLIKALEDMCIFYVIRINKTQTFYMNVFI